MNIFRLFTIFLYHLFIYLLFFSEWNLIESSDASHGVNPSSTTSRGTPSTTATGVSTSGSESGTSRSVEGGSTPKANGSQTPGATTTSPQANSGQGGGTTAGPTGGKETTKKTGVELDIKKTSATEQFEYKKNEKVVTYTAKGDYAFNLVKQNQTVIWKTDNEKEYATKVILNGKGEKNKVVEIHLLNNTTKSYKKDGKNKPWNQYDGKKGTVTSNNTSNGSSSGSEFELDIKDSDDKGNDQMYEVQKAFGGSKIYTIKTNVKCTTVKCNGKEVWKQDSSKNYGNVQKISYDKENNKISITLSSGYLVYNKSGEKWDLNNNESSKEKSGTATSGGGAKTTSGGGGTQPSGGTATTGQTGGGTQPSGGTATTGQTGGGTQPSGGGATLTSGGGGHR